MWSCVNRSVASVFLFETVTPAASKTVTTTVIISDSHWNDSEAKFASSAYLMSHTALHMHAKYPSFPTTKYPSW